MLRKSTSNGLGEVLKILKRILLVLVLISDRVLVRGFLGELRQHLSSRQGRHAPSAIFDNAMNSTLAQSTNMDRTGACGSHYRVAHRQMSRRADMR